MRSCILIFGSHTKNGCFLRTWKESSKQALHIQSTLINLKPLPLKKMMETSYLVVVTINIKQLKALHLLCVVVPFKIIDTFNGHYSREMFELFNVNDQKGLTVFEIENGVVDMTLTGDMCSTVQENEIVE